MFGGQTSDNPNVGPFFSLNDTWIWNGTNWIEQHPVTVPPLGVFSYYVMAYDERHEVIVMYGCIGSQMGSKFMTWSWDGSNWLEKHPTLSPTLNISSMTYDGNNIILTTLGGNSVWIWDGENWSIGPDSPLYSVDYNNSMFDEHRQTAVLPAITANGVYMMTFNGSYKTYKINTKNIAPFPIYDTKNNTTINLFFIFFVFKIIVQR